MQIIELTPDEAFVIYQMRQYGPYADFFIEKKPTDNSPTGSLIRIEATEKVKYTEKIEKIIEHIV